MIKDKYFNEEANLKSVGSIEGVIVGPDDEETNTVIENECDNDYTNLYNSEEFDGQPLPLSNKEQIR